MTGRRDIGERVTKDGLVREMGSGANSQPAVAEALAKWLMKESSSTRNYERMRSRQKTNMHDTAQLADLLGRLPIPARAMVAAPGLP